MFGAPPVGHVMDPQFKPVSFWGLWKYVCKCKYVYSINPIGGLAKGNITHMYIPVYMILCISMAGFRGHIPDL